MRSFIWLLLSGALTAVFVLLVPRLRRRRYRLELTKPYTATAIPPRIKVWSADEADIRRRCDPHAGSCRSVFSVLAKTFSLEMERHGQS